MASVKMLNCIVFDTKTAEVTGTVDPAIKVLGELPGIGEPFTVFRAYQAAQGRYEEAMLLLDHEDFVVWERPYRFIELTGEMFTNDFRTEIVDAPSIATAAEHTLVLLVDGNEAGRVPVFIDAPESAATMGALEEAATKSLQKGDVLWVTIPQPDGPAITRPAWYVFDGGRLFMLTGPQEQDLTNIAAAEKVQLTIKSKDVMATIATVTGNVEVVPSASDDFTRIGQAGLASRLNLPDGEAALDRWRQTCDMVAVTPQY